ncbi:hypothetical protein RhiirA5_439922, partial [Rhizophagus irregularis]
TSNEIILSEKTDNEERKNTPSTKRTFNSLGTFTRLFNSLGTFPRPFNSSLILNSTKMSYLVFLSKTDISYETPEVIFFPPDEDKPII